MELATERIKPRGLDEKEPIRIALIDGKEVKYFACSSRRNTYKKQEKNGHFEYIGKGIIWTIDGVQQSGNRKLHFWKNDIQL